LPGRRDARAEQVQADDKEHVLGAVGTAATAMRARLGESLSSIQKLNRPLEQATTSSLEALQSYTAGYAQLFRDISWLLFLRWNAPSRWIRISPWLLVPGIASNNAGDVRSKTNTTERLLR